jgi:hypothetical protein
VLQAVTVRDTYMSSWRTPQMFSYIPLYFAIFADLIVISINTSQSLAIVVPIVAVFMLMLVLTKYAEESSFWHI